MGNVYVVGPGGSGKTFFCVALALELQEEGLKVSYFKPVGASGEGREDQDAVLLRELLGMSVPLERMVPLTSSPYYLWRYETAHTYGEQIRQAYAEVARGAQVVIIGGAPSPYHLASLGLDAVGIVRLLQPLVFTVHRVLNDLSLDVAIAYQEYLRAHGARMGGLVLNQVPRALVNKAQDLYRRVLEDRGYRVLGIVPEFPEMARPTVRELAELLEAEVLAGEEGLADPVEDLVVGAMTLDSAMRYFRRAPNKAVITGGDRADLALAALETDTAVLVLTGGLHPEARVLAQAEERKVPVLLTNYDTLAAVDLLRAASRKLRPGDRHSLELVRESFRRYCDRQAIVDLVKQG
ncbi:MAG: DRTGG domain-containing protein [Moorellales bacterium]